ncbi:MAG: hypothetical protein WCJ02_13695 [bacterium]
MSHHTTEKRQRRPVVNNSAALTPVAGKNPTADHQADEKSTADLRSFADACFKKLLVKWPKATIAPRPKV